MALKDFPAPRAQIASIDDVVDFNRRTAMDAGKQDRWNRANAKDSFLNATLLGVALLVIAQAVMSGNGEIPMPQHEAAATATTASAA